MAGATPGRISVISTGPVALAVPACWSYSNSLPSMRSTRLPSSPYKLDLHVVQQRVALLQLDHLRGVNLEERVAAVRLRVGDAVGLLLDFNAQPLGQVAAIEGILPLAHGQKHHQRRQQQNSCPSTRVRIRSMVSRTISSPP
jgi:hypothetical protein